MLFSYGVPFVNGFLLSMGLIVGIGPQNTLILHQGLRRQHLLMMVVICALIDAGLILLGAVGVGGVLENETLRRALTYASAALLLVYGLRAFKSACLPVVTLGSDVLPSRRQVILMLLAVSLLNPATYLDTLLLIGANASSYQDELRLWFAAGAICASLGWFAGLSYGSALLAPVFRQQRALRLLNLSSGSVLCFMALRLCQP